MSLTAVFVLLHGGLVMAQANDLCSNASAVADGATAFDSTGAAKDGPDDCPPIGADIWYQYTASCTGPLIVDTVGSSYDTTLVAYDTWECPPNLGTQLGCNDDGPGIQSLMEFDVTSGQEVLIRVGGNVGDTGTGALNIVCGPPSNDECGNATVIPTSVYSSTINTSNATTAFDDPDIDIGCTGGMPPTQSVSVWYIFKSVNAAEITIDTCASGYDTVLAVFDATGGCPVTTPNMAACNDDTCGSGAGLQSQVIFTATAGTHYLVQVMAHGSDPGGSMTLNFHSDGVFVLQFNARHTSFKELIERQFPVGGNPEGNAIPGNAPAL